MAVRDRSWTQAALVLLAPWLSARTAVAADPPDIVLVTIDTLRADHVGWHGYFRDTTPELDRLAAESLVFERCLAPMATTLPSHTSLFTATHPLEHGVLSNALAGEEIPERAPKLIVFAEYLRGIGYETVAIPSALPLKRRFGLDTGFDHYQGLGGYERPAKHATGAALQHLRAERSQPLFLWVHYFDPHSPYAPPKAFRGTFPRDEEVERYVRERRFTEVAERPTGAPNELYEGLDGYDGEVRYADQEVGRLLDHLRQRGWDRTVVVVVADHGEGLNQHGEPGHGLVWDEQLHVPLLVRVPGEAPRRVATQLSIADVLPTLLGLLDLPDEDRFLSQASGANVLHTDRPERNLLALSSERQVEYGVASYALTAPRWKLVLSADGSERLYDRARDPFELEDVRADHPEEAAALRRELDELVSRHTARGQELGVGGRRSLTSEERAGLEALGYLGGGDDEGDGASDDEE